MKVNTKRFGELDIQPAQLFHMVEPPVGLSDESFALIWDPRTEPVQWLQSTTTPQLCLPVVDPLVVHPGFDAVIPPEELEALEIKRIEDAIVRVVLVLSADPGSTRANLRAPFVLSVVSHKGKQIVLNDPDLPIQYYLGSREPAESNKEVADVGLNT